MDRSRLPKSYLQKGFSRAFKLYNEKYKNDDYFGAYFLGFSILEDRINVLWIVALWYKKDKYLYDENKPNYWDISKNGLQTKVDDLYSWGYFSEIEKKRLKAVIKDRNTNQEFLVETKVVINSAGLNAAKLVNKIYEEDKFSLKLILLIFC